jgi:hypothetical protein
MYIHEEWGTIFEIGDSVKYRNIRGIVTDAVLPTKNKFGYCSSEQFSGYYRIIDSNNKQFIDYHYVFELDREGDRERKLNNLLNG